MEIDIEKTKKYLQNVKDVHFSDLIDLVFNAESIVKVIQIILDTEDREIVEQGAQELHEYVDNLRKARIAMLQDVKQNSVTEVAEVTENQGNNPSWADMMLERFSSGGIK